MANANRRITIEIEAITRGASSVKALGSEYEKAVAKARNSLAALKSGGKEIERSVIQSARAYENLGRQIDKINAKRDALGKKLNDSGASVNKAQFVAMTSQIVKAGDAVDRLKSKQDGIANDAAKMQKSYAQNVNAIRQAEAALSRMTSTQRRVFEAVRGGALSVGRDILRSFTNAGRQSVRSFDPVRRALDTIGRVKLSPDFRVNIDPLTGGLTRAIALGTILANTLLGIGKASLNFAVSNIGAGVNAVGTLERFDLLVGTIAEQQALENNTVKERVRIGTKLLTSEEQRVAAGEKAIKNSVTESDLQRGLYDIERARLSLEADRLDVAEYKPGKRDSDARSDLEFRQALLNVRGSELQLAEAQADYDKLSTKAAEQREQALKFIPRVIPQYKTITKVTATETELLEQQARIKQDILKWNKQLTINSPFTREQVSNAFVLAQTYGFSVDQAKSLTEQLVDYSAATGKTSEQVEGIARALGQVKAEEKLKGQEVLQLVNNGVPLYKILSKELDKTVSELREMGEQGKLTADVVIPALQKYFKTFEGKGAKSSRETIGGIISSFSDLREFNLASLFEPATTQLKPVLLDLLDFLSSEETDKLFRRIGESIAKPIKAVKLFSNAIKNGFSVIDSIRSTVTNLFPDVDLNQLETILAIPRELESVKNAFLKTNLGKLITDIPKKFGQFASNARIEFERLKTAFNIDGVKGVFQSLGFDSSTASKIESIANAIGKIGQGVLDLDGNKIKNAVSDIASTVFESIRDSNIGQKIADGFKSVLISAGQGIYNAFSEGGIASQAINGLATSLSNLASQAASKFSELKVGEKIASGARSLVGEVGKSIREFVISAVDPQNVIDDKVAKQIGDTVIKIGGFLLESALRLGQSIDAALGAVLYRIINELRKGIVRVSTDASRAIVDALTGMLKNAFSVLEKTNNAIGLNIIPIPDFDKVNSDLKRILDAGSKASISAIDSQLSEDLKTLRDAANKRDKEILQLFGATSVTSKIPVGIPVQVQQQIGAGSANAASAAFDESIFTAQQKAQAFKQNIGVQATSIKDTVGLTTTDVVQKFDSMSTAIESSTTTAFENVNSVIGSKGNEIRGTVDGTIKGIKQEWIVNADWPILGVEFVNGIIKGIDRQETALYRRIRALIAQSITVAKEEGGIRSPSKKTEFEVGLPMGQGIEKGILRTVESVKYAMQNLVASGINSGANAVGNVYTQTSPSAISAQFPRYISSASQSRFVADSYAPSRSVVFSGPVNVRNDSDIKQIAWQVGAVMARMAR